MEPQTPSSCLRRTFAGIIVFALLVAGLIGQANAQFRQAAPRSDVGKHGRNDPPAPSHWTRSYVAPNDSTVVIQTAVPLTTIRAAMIKAIVKEKEAKALPVVVTEDPGKPVTIQTVIKEPVTERVSRDRGRGQATHPRSVSIRASPNGEEGAPWGPHYLAAAPRATANRWDRRRCHREKEA